MTHVVQVPGMGVQGVCSHQAGIAASPMSYFVRFGSLEFVKTGLPAGSQAHEQIEIAAKEQRR